MSSKIKQKINTKIVEEEKFNQIDLNDKANMTKNEMFDLKKMQTDSILKYEQISNMSSENIFKYPSNHSKPGPIINPCPTDVFKLIAILSLSGQFNLLL